MRNHRALVLVALCLGCGGSATALAPGNAASDLLSPPSLGTACFLPASVTPHTLILHSENNIPGEYLVMFMAGVEEPSETAEALAQKYNGKVIRMFDNWGFAVAIDDALAPTFAQEPVVCFAEQNGKAHG